MRNGTTTPTKGQSDIHRINLGFGPTRSRKDEKEAEKEKVAESVNYCKKWKCYKFNLEPREWESEYWVVTSEWVYFENQNEKREKNEFGWWRVGVGLECGRTR